MKKSDKGGYTIQYLQCDDRKEKEGWKFLYEEQHL